MPEEFNIDMPPHFFEADGDFNGESKESRLSNQNTLIINGQYFHLEAIEVTEENGTEAVNEALQGDLDKIADINGAYCGSQLINGRHYVIIIHPYGI